jgi:hypothetical protein
MLGEKQVISDASGHPDAGVVVASHYNDFDVIVNVLFAFHPFAPAIDVYDRGQLMAGYQFETVDACIAELSTVLGRHLGRPSPIINYNGIWRKKMSEKEFVVIGGSSGIGLDITRLLSQSNQPSRSFLDPYPQSTN